MKTNFKGILLCMILAIAVLAVSLPGCGKGTTNTSPSATTATTSSAPASTTVSTTTTIAKPEIRIGIMGGQTGTGKSAVVPFIEEMEIIFRYINEVEGGVSGAKLAWKVSDNQGTPDGAIMAYKELRDTFHPSIYLVVEDYLYAGIKDMIEQDQAVIITSSSLQNSLYITPGRFFSLSLPTANGFAAYASWVLADWTKNHANAGRPPKIGVLYWDMASGLQWKVSEAWVKKQGVELVPVSYPMTSIDLKTQFMQLRDAQVDYIWMNCITQQAALAIRDFGGLGLIGKIPFSFMEMVESRPLIELVGPGANGFYLYRSEDPSSDGSQAAKLWTTIMKWGTNSEKWSDNRLSITFKAVLEAAIKQAASDAGWDKINNQTLYAALNKLNSIDTWGNMKDFGFGPSKRVGVSNLKMAQFTASGTVSVSGYIVLPRVFEGVDK